MRTITDKSGIKWNVEALEHERKFMKEMWCKHFVKPMLVLYRKDRNDKKDNT